MDILIIVAEVGVLIFVTVLLNWILGIVFNQLATLSRFQDYTQRLARLHRTIRKIVTLSGVLLCLLIIGVNGFVIYKGISVQKFQLDLIQLIPPQFWSTLGTNILKSVIIILLVKLSLPLLNKLIDTASIRAQNYDEVDANDESIADFFALIIDFPCPQEMILIL